MATQYGFIYEGPDPGRVVVYHTDSVDPVPAVHDRSLGYRVGSRWFNTASDEEFVCLDDTVGAAVWLSTTSGGGGGGAVSSVFGRTGAVVAILNDYSASLIDNDSGVTGATVADALDFLLAAIGGGGAVSSVFGRTVAVVAVAGDYVASEVTNDSGVTGAFVSNALDDINSKFPVVNADLASMATGTFKARLTAGTSDPEDITGAQATTLLSVFAGDLGAGGAKGLVPAPAAGDAAAFKYLGANATWSALDSDKVTNVSTVAGAAVSDALETLSAGLGGAVGYQGYSHQANFTWVSTTWAGIHTVLTLSDAAAVGISRTNSSFTFSVAGLYLFILNIPVYSNGVGRQVGLRLRRSGVTVAKQNSYADNQTALSHVPLQTTLIINAADVVTVEYCAGAATATGSFTDLDGEQHRDNNITIVRLGN